jgi:NAD(P)-dependent dehydrogenase (short-subunit alcohol dehydrogenase family)
MDLQLEGKIALVSGASAGIGRETARTLAGEGAQTIIVARRGALLETLADEIEADGGIRPMVIVEDLSDRAAFGRIRDRVSGTFGHIDILINNLGDPFPAAQLGDAVLAAQARQHDPDILLRSVQLARPASDVSDSRLGTAFQTLRLLSHLRSPSVTTMSQKSSVAKTPQSVP